ncbi:GxxExxY protein [Candidatus Gottesmanbacteria bacterium]|nr:GxxExxY protein [Candidatus Gottesmanbacteria bacterium]
MLLLPTLVRMVVGICFRIHEEGGPTLDDEQYREAIKDELTQKGLHFRCDEEVELEYLGKVVDRHVIDFIIEDKVLLDTKGKDLLHHKMFYKQMTAYLLKENLPLAFVVDFHSHKLQIRRIINPNYNYQLQEVSE